MSSRHQSRSRPGQVSRRAERHFQTQRSARQRRLIVFGGAIVLAAIVAVGLILVNRDRGGSSLPAVVAAAGPDAAIPADGTALGDPNAPVTVIEYGDYQCPGCAQFATGDQQRLIEEYVATGRVRLEFHVFPFLDQVLRRNTAGTVTASGDGESVRAAQASLCAVDQGAFWRYHDTVYANHQGENDGAYTRARLIEMASTIGLDADAFAACLDAGTHKADVEVLYTAASQAGVVQTPSFAVNGEVNPYRGYDDLTAKIDAALAG